MASSSSVSSRPQLQYLTAVLDDLRAKGTHFRLRVLEDGVMLQSEACLIVSRTAQWTAARKSQLDAVLARLGTSAAL